MGNCFSGHFVARSNATNVENQEKVKNLGMDENLRYRQFYATSSGGEKHSLPPARKVRFEQGRGKPDT
jgi:hypothetical protein